MSNVQRYRVLGIDPGLNITGYGIVDFASGARGPAIVEGGTIRTDAKADIARRITQIHADLAELIAEFKPDLVAIENLYAHYAHPRTSILMAHARAIVVPFAGGKESEQTVRAKLLAERGCLKMIDPAELGPKILAAKIDEALAGVPARAKGLNFDGGAGTAAALHALCRQSG